MTIHYHGREVHSSPTQVRRQRIENLIPSQVPVVVGYSFNDFRVVFYRTLCGRKAFLQVFQQPLGGNTLAFLTLRQSPYICVNVKQIQSKLLKYQQQQKKTLK